MGMEICRDHICPCQHLVDNSRIGESDVLIYVDVDSIEQDADTVIMLYRNDYYYPDSENPNVVDVFIRKNRDGDIGDEGLYFDRAKMQFRSLSKNLGCAQSQIANH